MWPKSCPITTLESFHVKSIALASSRSAWQLMLPVTFVRGIGATAMSFASIKVGGDPKERKEEKESFFLASSDRDL